MAATLPRGAQLDIADIASEIASDPTATSNLAATFLELAGGTMTGDLTVEGTIVGDKDNATSLRVRGLQHVSEGVAKVQSYSGIFTNAAYSGTGTLNTRVIHGANLEMDLEIQGPHQVRLAAVDDTQSDGQIFATSRTDFVFNMRADAEVASPRQLIVDRVDKGSTGAANTSDVEISVSAGTLNVASEACFEEDILFKQDLEVDGQLNLAAGTAMDPALFFVGDTDTGFWWSGADAIDIATGGFNRFRVESDGTLSAQTASYEALVTSDQDMTNKKYVDDGLTAHTGDATIHFTEASISHLNIADNGANSHADIDTHIADGGIHRELDDGLTTATNLWSASKIDSELDAKVDVIGDTMTGDLTMEADLIMDNASVTQVFLANGTLVDPALTFQSDTNTGLWWAGADIIELITGGLARFRVAANGLLTATTASYESLVFGNADALPNLAYIDANYLNLGGGTLTGALEVSAGGIDVSGGNLDVTAADLNVTVGDVTVTAGDLEVTAGIIRAPLGSVAAPSYTFVGDTNTGIYSTLNNVLDITTGGTRRVAVDSTGVEVFTGDLTVSAGNVNSFTTFRGGEGTAGAPTFGFTVGGTSGMWQNNTDEVDIATAGVNRFTVGSDGTLEVKTGSYESLVTDDDDIPNKKYVDDADAAVAAASVPIVAPSIALLPATPKGALGPLGPGSAVHPPGSFAFVVDDAAGPTPFTMAVVDPSPGWVRVDLPGVYIA